VAAVLRVVLTADTHLPRRARALPAELWAAIDAADLVVHAGDWVEPPLLDELEQRAARLVGVHGNNDGAELRRRLPEVAREDMGGLRLGVVHETGSSAGRERRCDELYADDLDVLVFGHSHIPWDTTTPRGLRLLNPGSPTDRRRQRFCTYLTLAVTGGRLHDVTLHRLPPRSTPPTA
jgi:putative phosphoesterase